MLLIQRSQPSNNLKDVTKRNPLYLNNYLNNVKDIKQAYSDNKSSREKLEFFTSAANNQAKILNNIETFLNEKPVERKKVICHIRNQSNTKSNKSMTKENDLRQPFEFHRKHFYSYEEVIDLIIGFQEEIDYLKQKIDRNKNQMNFEKRNLSHLQNKLINESFIIKNKRKNSDMNGERIYNKGLLDQLDREHKKASKALIELDRLKNKNQSLREGVIELENQLQ